VGGSSRSGAYRVEPISDDPDVEALVFSEAFWNRLDVFQHVYRNREFGDVANAFAAWREPGSGVSVTGRVHMRGLYLAAAEFPWDRLVLWFRRLSRRASTWS
jgi:hypothetical protein